MKRCITCGEKKELSEFQKRKVSKDGHRGQCKVCKAEYNRQYRLGNAEAIDERKRQWRADNAEAVAEQQRKYRQDNAEAIDENQRQWRADNAEAIAAHNAVNNAVTAGRLPPISECQCEECQALGISKQAEHRHHHLSYEPEHWFHFEELCRVHHIARHA